MTSKKFSTQKFLKGLLIGGVLGGSTGLLLAPRSGKKLRQEVDTTSRNLTQDLFQIKQDAKNVSHQVQRVLTLVNTMIPKAIEETEKDVARFQFKANPRLDDIKQQITKITTELDDFQKTLK
ncbi:hypothetical protein CBF34_10205 [Vagococcus penaei]|uniref:Uncharacterized protein n=1 Tax=Vagococcus penaei TaxID=633807 RepID=A0A1Q2D6N3_9ENTE|nr:YtxH domain-containing protein [Vagococcus penaei]AQP54088.1 hypothetical protein BW732_07560 [Vagococcus penaei]RST98496.1 hypothetical protein CBF34_10205 [Vagococcus penaei]